MVEEMDEKILKLVSLILAIFGGVLYYLYEVPTCLGTKEACEKTFLFMIRPIGIALAAIGIVLMVIILLKKKR